MTSWSVAASWYATGSPALAFFSMARVSRTNWPRLLAPLSGASWLSLALMALAEIETTVTPSAASASAAASYPA